MLSISASESFEPCQLFQLEKYPPDLHLIWLVLAKGLDNSISFMSVSEMSFLYLLVTFCLGILLIRSVPSVQETEVVRLSWQIMESVMLS